MFKPLGILSAFGTLAVFSLLFGSPAAADSAKTIRVQEKILNFDDSTGKLAETYDNSVAIDRAGKVNAVITDDATHKLIAKYMVDGQWEHDYIVHSQEQLVSRYVPHPSLHDDLRDLSAVDLILSGQPPAPDAAAKREVSTVEIDGKPLQLTVDTLPKTRTSYWLDMTTHLPYRVLDEVILDGKWISDTQTDFSGWKFDQPIPASQFTWHVPPKAKAPDFAVLSPDGKTVHLSDYKGKIVILDFWATWCGPCQQSMPHLEKVYQQIKANKDIAVLAVCVLDEKANFDNWLTQNNGTVYHFPIAYDPKKDAKESIVNALYHVDGIPSQFVIDKKGLIVVDNTGYEDGDTRLEYALNKLGIECSVKAEDAK